MNWGLGDLSIPDQITAAANKYGVPPWLALAVATRESGLNQAARGTSGEIGVFQLMPTTASDLGVNPSDLSQNIDGGVKYLSQMFGKFGDWFTALEAYNAGPGNVSRGTVVPAAQQYATAILGSPGPVMAADPGEVPNQAVTLDSVYQGFGVSDPLTMAGLALLGIGALWAVSK